jgi:hypothetical protein
MDVETKNALEESIAHWERNVKAETPEEAGTRAEDCALCQLFYDGDDFSQPCEGCPVKNKTGIKNCGNTPYYSALEKLVWWTTEYESNFSTSNNYKIMWCEAAQAELDFLKSLRPVGDENG